MNDFRTGDDAWYWNEENTEKVTVDGLQTLVIDKRLEQTAMKRAAELVIYYSHTRPSGEKCWTAFDEEGYTYSNAGENIAIGYSSADLAFNAWKEENENYSGQGHRRNMLNSRFTAIGIGHASYQWVENGVTREIHCWVQDFGRGDNDTSLSSPNDMITNVGIVTLNSHVTQINSVEIPNPVTLRQYRTKHSI